MDENRELIIFGPVPSRRLGRSLGINNIPPKICTYSCIYCQIGRTLKLQIKRENFYNPGQILKDVNSMPEEIIKIADFITKVNAKKY